MCRVIHVFRYLTIFSNVNTKCHEYMFDYTSSSIRGSNDANGSFSHSFIIARPIKRDCAVLSKDTPVDISI